MYWRVICFSICFSLFTASSNVNAGRDYKVVIVSCAKIHEVSTQNIWRKISELNPDLLLFVGDMVYLDKKHRNQKSMEMVFQEQWGEPNFRSLINKVPYFAIWDDHDAGTNDIIVNAFSHELREKYIPLYNEARRSFVPRMFSSNLALYGNVGISNISLPDKSHNLRSKYDFAGQSSLDYSFDFGGARFIMLDTISSRTESGWGGSILSNKQFAFIRKNLDNHSGLNFIVSGASVHLSKKWGWRLGYKNDYLKLKSLLRQNSIILSGDSHRNSTIPPHESIGAIELVSSGVALSEKRKGNYLIVSFSRDDDLHWRVKYEHFGQMKKKYKDRFGEILVNH